MSLHRAQVVLDVPDTNCLKHGTKLALYFCKTCNESGCSKCMQTKHKLHDWCDIEDIADEKQKELEKNVNTLETDTLPKLKEKKQSLEKEEGIRTGEIDRHADIMIDLINNHRQILKTKVALLYSAKTETATIIANLDQDIVDVEQIIRNSKKSIAIQANTEIVQGNENVKIVIKEVGKSLVDIGQHTTTDFLPGVIDSFVLKQMVGDVKSDHDVPSLYVTVEVKHNLSIGQNIIRLSPIGSQAWIHEERSGKVTLIDVHGKEIKTLDSMYPQDMAIDVTGSIYLGSFSTGVISKMAPDNRVIDIANTKPLRPISLCVTQSGDILVAIVDTLLKDFAKCKQTYVVKLDIMGSEKQKIALDDIGKKGLFKYLVYVNENGNGDIVVIDRLDIGKGRLYILSDKGKVKFSFSGSSDLVTPFNPTAVCCDDQCRIIVTDLNNFHLHLLNAKAEPLQLLMTKKDGLVNPYSIGLCNEFLWIGTMEGKVIVAEYKPKQVKGIQSCLLNGVYLHINWNSLLVLMASLVPFIILF